MDFGGAKGSKNRAKRFGEAVRNRMQRRQPPRPSSMQQMPSGPVIYQEASISREHKTVIYMVLFAIITYIAGWVMVGNIKTKDKENKKLSSSDKFIYGFGMAFIILTLAIMFFVMYTVKFNAPLMGIILILMGAVPIYSNIIDSSKIIN